MQKVMSYRAIYSNEMIMPIESNFTIYATIYLHKNL